MKLYSKTYYPSEDFYINRHQKGASGHVVIKLLFTMEIEKFDEESQ